MLATVKNGKSGVLVFFLAQPNLTLGLNFICGHLLVAFNSAEEPVFWLTDAVVRKCWGLFSNEVGGVACNNVVMAL